MQVVHFIKPMAVSEYFPDQYIFVIGFNHRKISVNTVDVISL